MIIGVLKEILTGENRVSVSPDTVKRFISDGHSVLIEKNAGVNSFFDDDSFIESGATIIETAKEVYDRAELILKVKEPQFNEELNIHEVDLMKEGQYLITFLHPASPNNHELIEKLKNQGVISLTLDGVPRISRAQSMDALSSMSTCAGYKGMIMAIDKIPKFAPMIGSAVGMIKPANVLVVGTGVAGLRAVATAKSLGAQVYSTDLRSEANEQAKSLGAQIIDLDIPKKIAVSKDGLYAQELPEKWLFHEKEELKELVKDADIVFLTALVFNKEAPVIIDEEMVKSMKRGSVIVDVSIDQGGNCELTVPGKTITKYGVTIDGTKNIPGLIPVSSTEMLSKNIYNLVSYLVKDNKFELNLKDEVTSSILVTNNKKIVHKGTLEAMKRGKK